MFKHHLNTIISVYSELLKNKVGDFLYGLNLTINLIQKEKLASFDNVNHLKIYIIHSATLSARDAVKIPILNQEIEFNVMNPDIGTFRTKCKHSLENTTLKRTAIITIKNLYRSTYFLRI